MDRWEAKGCWEDFKEIHVQNIMVKIFVAIMSYYCTQQLCKLEHKKASLSCHSRMKILKCSYIQNKS
jgi:hypothetical protein